MRTPQVSPPGRPFLNLYVSAGIFACPIFCLKRSTSAHRDSSLRPCYPPPNMDTMRWGRRAEALHREFKVGRRPQGILRVLPPQSPSRQPRSGFSLLSPDRGGGGRENTAGETRRGEGGMGREGATGEIAVMRL